MGTVELLAVTVCSRTFSMISCDLLSANVRGDLSSFCSTAKSESYTSRIASPARFAARIVVRISLSY